MTSLFVHIDRIEKRFGPVKAVDSASLGIGRGEFFSLLGPSGCGKTTLLRIIGGLDRPTSGCVHIDGQDVTDLPSYRRPTNMVFQSYAIFPHLSVGENIAYGLRRQKLSAGDKREQVGRMLEMIRLSGFAERRPDQLSGGQLQRVALARALILKPKVLLLDEPLAALDKKLRENMQIELRALQREVGITFIFVTHDQEEALTLSDRIAVMDAGRVLQCSTPKTLYECPATRQVAAFVGEMNFFDGRIEAANGISTLVLVEGLGRMSVAGPTNGYAAGQKVTVALRPERFMVAPAGAGSLACKIHTRAYFGDRTHCLVEIPGLTRMVTISCANTGGEAIEANASINLLPDPAGAIILAES